MAIVTLYSKPGCHLCDDARAALMDVLRMHPFQLDEVNIERQAELMAEYGARIPVVLFNGKYLFEDEVDKDRLRQLLKEIH